ncbi:uncharacterized protein L201_000574 [Kwoniella dendrophila CBS 6074]|uniref:Uncharacterized protein n=1 Tax=Kwoniella dendrophila CBS 6074 TaxID=1295534 RepID=A0AAX4JMT5_9TREE
MTEPIKPRRKVTSQISLAPSPSPSPSTPSTSVPARVRAHVTPSSTSSPSSSERPSIRSTPSALCIRSTPTSRARSPAPGLNTPGLSSSTSTPHARITTRAPRTPITSTLPPRSTVGLTPKDAKPTPIAKVRAARSVVDGPSSSSSTLRTPDIRRSNTSSEDDIRKRTISSRSSASGTSQTLPTTARVRQSGASSSITPSTPIHSHNQNQPQSQPLSRPLNSVESSLPSPSIQTPPINGIPSSSPIPHVISTPTASDVNQEDSFSINGLGMDDGGLRILQSTWRDVNSSPERIPNGYNNEDEYEDGNGISSNRSSPSRRSPVILPHALSSAQHALAYIFQHPTASAPTSPIPPSTPTLSHHHQNYVDDGLNKLHKNNTFSHTHHNHTKSKTKLPYYNPNGYPPSLPPLPISPELKTVALPSLTPARSSEDWSRTNSSQGYGTSTSIRKYSGTSSGLSDGQLPQLKEQQDNEGNRDRLSGITAVEDHGESSKLNDGQDVDVVLEEDAQQAKINRKIADLEISNASLLAINKTLEATKSKQRTEILKLRRMLRESLGGGVGLPMASFGLSSMSLMSPSIDSPFEEGDMHNQEEIGYFDEEMIDPQIEARWDKLAELVINMKKLGQESIEKTSKEDIKAPGHGRVLDWMEIEKNERRQDENSEQIGDISIDSMASSSYIQENEGNDDYAGGETSREEVEGVI